MRHFMYPLAGLISLSSALAAQVPPPPSMAPVPTLAAPIRSQGNASRGYDAQMPDVAVPHMLPMPEFLDYEGATGPIQEYGPAPGPVSSMFGPCPVTDVCPDCPLPLPSHSMPVPTPVVAVVPGYPFYKVPVPATSLARHSAGHCLRKRAFFHVSPGNMIPSRPIYPVAGGSYYFRPYTYGNVAEQQLQASLWRMHPGFPYAEVAAAASYPNTTSCLTDPRSPYASASELSIPSRAFQQYHNERRRY